MNYSIKYINSHGVVQNFYLVHMDKAINYTDVENYIKFAYKEPSVNSLEISEYAPDEYVLTLNINRPYERIIMCNVNNVNQYIEENEKKYPHETMMQMPYKSFEDIWKVTTKSYKAFISAHNKCKECEHLDFDYHTLNYHNNMFCKKYNKVLGNIPILNC